MTVMLLINKNMCFTLKIKNYRLIKVGILWMYYIYNEKIAYGSWRF